MAKKLAEMSREQLLDAWAKVVLNSEDLPPPASATETPTAGYDVELGRMRLEFKIKKFEAEEARRKEERELEEARSREELEIIRLTEE